MVKSFIKKIPTIAALISLLLSWQSCSTARFRMLSADKKEVTFIFCSDFHVGTADDAQYLKTIFEQWKNNPVPFDFIVVAGDLTKDGTIEQLSMVRDVLDNTEKTYFVLPGNHDISGGADDGKSSYRKVFGSKRENYLIRHKGIALLFLDLTDGEKIRVEVKDITYRWLEAELKKLHSNIPIIVFSHFPLHPQAPDMAVQNSDRLFEILDRRKVLAYFSGHWHGLWKQYRNDVPFYGTTSILPGVRNFDGTTEKGGLLVKIKDREIDVEFINAQIK